MFDLIGPLICAGAIIGADGEYGILKLWVFEVIGQFMTAGTSVDVGGS